MAVLVEINNVCKHFVKGDETITPLDGVYLDIEQGEFISLMGASGCGKSTLLNLVAGIDQPTSGSLVINGTDIGSLSRSKLAGWRAENIGYVFQSHNLIPVLTAYENIELPLLLLPLSRQQRRERVEIVLQAVALVDRANHYPRQMSGGQCQRISIARALTVNPEILICDEPVSALDVSVQAKILNLLEDMKARYDLSLVFISHDLSVVRNVSDRVVVMYLGKLCEVGGADRLYEAPAHPYTRALLASAPEPARSVGVADAVLGDDLPSPTDPPSGCRFRTRCPLAIDRCAVEEPLMQKIDEDHFVACHLPFT